MVDAETLQVLEANPAFQRNLGYTLGEARALTVNELFTDGSGDPES